MLRRLQLGCENAGTVRLWWHLGCRRQDWASCLRAQGSWRKWLSKQNYALIHVGMWQRNVRPLNLGFKFVVSLGFVTCAWILILMYIGELISLLNLSMHKKKTLISQNIGICHVATAHQTPEIPVSRCPHQFWTSLFHMIISVHCSWILMILGDLYVGLLSEKSKKAYETYRLLLTVIKYISAPYPHHFNNTYASIITEIVR